MIKEETVIIINQYTYVIQIMKLMTFAIILLNICIILKYMALSNVNLKSKNKNK